MYTLNTQYLNNWSICDLYELVLWFNCFHLTVLINCSHQLLLVLMALIDRQYWIINVFTIRTYQSRNSSILHQHTKRLIQCSKYYQPFYS